MKDTGIVGATKNMITSAQYCELAFSSFPTFKAFINFCEVRKDKASTYVSNTYQVFYQEMERVGI